jgi:transcriptional regulator with XRE-family HTH domain
MRNRIKTVRLSLNMSLRDMETASNIIEGGIDRSVWRNVEAGKQRINEDHITVVRKIAPQYIYWVITGETLPESGQISPEIEEKCEELLKTGTDG